MKRRFVKRLIQVSIFALLILLLPLMASRAAAAPPITEDSLVDVWVFVDSDQNGVYSAGDTGLSDNLVCLSGMNGKKMSCVGTDYGDVWWEITKAGRFVAKVDAATIPAGYQLNSILCKHTRGDAVYSGCKYNNDHWSVQFKLPYGTRINIFYALGPVE